MKSFVVMTYYHLMHSVAMALTLDEKPALFFSRGYLDIQEDLLQRIRETGVFSFVRGITGRGELREFINELQKTKDYTQVDVDRMGSSLFEKYLEPYYEELFKGADFDDTLYVYNDFQWEQYYIDKHFNEIVGIEDGYGSIEQQLSIHKFKGDHELKNKFLGRYYPEPLYKSPKIKKIISSKYFDNIPDSYKEKMEIIDFNDLVEANRDEFRDALYEIFDITDYEIHDGSVLFLGQPLARALYCNAADEYMLIRKAMQKEVDAGREVYFKSHPADWVDARIYETDKVHILPKNFPIELLNYQNCTFDKVLSFGSTGTKTLSCAKSFEMIFKPQKGGTREEIASFIKEYVKDQSITTYVHYLVRELTPEVYVNVYSCLLSNNAFKQNAYVLVQNELLEKSKEYFAKDNMGAMISAFKKNNSINDVCVWEDELDVLLKKRKTFSEPVILRCEDIDSKEDVLDSIRGIQSYYDYLLVVEQSNLLFSHMRDLRRELKKKMNSIIIYPSFSKAVDIKTANPLVPLSYGFIEGVVSSSLLNRLWHRTAVKILLDTPETKRTDALAQYEMIGRKFYYDLFVPSYYYPSGTEGFEHYVECANNLIYNHEDDDRMLTSKLMLIFCDYMDWHELKRGTTPIEAISTFIDRLEINDSLKLRILEDVCLNLQLEKKKKFRFSVGEDIEIGRYLNKKVGMSKTILRSTETIKKVKRKAKKAIKR